MEKHFNHVGEMLIRHQPVLPVYCIYPHLYREAAREFVREFPGRVLYAVKANAEAEILRELHAGGVRHFDCASLPEIEHTRQVCPQSTCYFMSPVRLRGAAAVAQNEHGVRHFVVDHPDALRSLSHEVRMRRSVVFARMAVNHESAVHQLSRKFGAPPAQIPALIQAIAQTGAEPALAFNVGSSVVSPDAYEYALGKAREVLEQLPAPLRLIDVGGGYPKSYPGFEVPPLREFFTVLHEGLAQLPIAPNGELMAEPGRALAAPGLSCVTEVLLRKDQRLYLNDGMYGIFWELRCGGHDRYPTRVYRNGRPLQDSSQSYRLYGPTCDSGDVMPGEVQLPVDIREGDYIEFGGLGAYSLSGRTNFNGHYSEHIISITGADQRPPGAD